MYLVLVLPSSSTAKLAKATFPATGGTATFQLGNIPEDDTHTKYRLGTTTDYQKTYTMVIWLDETGKDQSNTGVQEGTTGAEGTDNAGQTNEAGKAFAAGLTISSGGGTGVTGVISALGN